MDRLASKRNFSSLRFSLKPTKFANAIRFGLDFDLRPNFSPKLKQ